MMEELEVGPKRRTKNKFWQNQAEEQTIILAETKWKKENYINT